MLPLFRALTFLYPYGATLSVIKPAVAVLSTGSECFPFNRPVLAFHQGKVSEIEFETYSITEYRIPKKPCNMLKDVMSCRKLANWLWWVPATSSVINTSTKRKTVKSWWVENSEHINTMETQCIMTIVLSVNTKYGQHPLLSSFLGRCPAVAHDWRHWDESDRCWRTRGQKVALLRFQTLSLKLTDLKNFILSDCRIHCYSRQ